MGQLPSIINIMNKTLLGILCLHICLLIGLSQSRQARMDSEWKSKRSISARDGGHQKFPSPEVDPCERKKRSEQSGRDGGQQKFPIPLVDFHPNSVLNPHGDFDPNSFVLGKRDGGHPKFTSPEVDENVDDPCSRKKRYNYQTGRDGGQQKFPSPDPCNLKKRSEQSGRDGGQQKFPSPGEKRSGIVSDIDPTSLQTGLGNEKRAELNPYNRMGNLQKRLNPHHRMAPDFAKRSAKRLHEPELDFTELFQTLEEGTNDDAIIVEGKRDNSNLIRPLPKDPEEEGKIVEVKRMGWNPHHTKPYQTDFDKRSAQAEWQTNTNPLFRPLNENTEEGANEDAIIAVGNKRSTLDQVYQDYKGLTWLTDKATNGDAIVQLGNGGAIVPLGNEKRSAQAEWQTNTNPLFRPLNENTEEG